MMGRRRKRWWRSLFGPSLSQLSSWDRGVLEAHWMGSVRTQKIRECQSRALRQRRGLFALLWPPRRRYLEGLLRGIDAELRRRGKES